MSRLNFILILTILCTCISCQTPTLKADDLPNASPTPARLLIQPTLTPHRVGDIPAWTITPSPVIATATPMPSPTLTFSTMTEIGRSVGGRALTAQRIGTGSHVLLLVGGIHGGYEANTVTLMNQLIDHFVAQPNDLPADTALLIVPVANPDGLAVGESPGGRLNEDGVDLNRNWGCNWSPNAYWRSQRVNPGAQAMSEPETQALAALIQAERPAAALFYHSAAGAIYAGDCDGSHGSAALGALLGRAAGYSYGSGFSAYPVTGTASDWVDGLGIPSADVELSTHGDSEYARNLRGVIALLAWLAEDS